MDARNKCVPSLEHEREKEKENVPVDRLALLGTRGAGSLLGGLLLLLLDLHNLLFFNRFGFDFLLDGLRLRLLLDGLGLFLLYYRIWEIEGE